MFGTIRKHQRWLWVFIIAAVIISFVAFFSPNQGKRGGIMESEASVGLVDGKPVTRYHAQEVLRQAMLSGYLRFGENYQSAQAQRMGFNLQQEFARRLFLDARTKADGIHVSDEAVAQWIQTHLKDPRTGEVNLEGFVQNDLKRGRFSESEFFDFVRQEIAIEELERLVGVTGQLITPQEAEAEFRRANETFSVSLAHFSGSNHVAGITLDDTALGAFFTNRIAQYRIPERLALSYVRFELTNFLADAGTRAAAIPDLTNRIEQIYLQRGADNFRDPIGNPLAKPAALDQIREGLMRQLALQAAGEKAVAFANELGQMEPLVAANLTTLAQKQGLTVQQVPPFASGDRPFGLEDLRDFDQALSRITPEQPFTPPMEGSRGIVIAAVTGRLPSVIPSLDTVRPRLESDFRQVRSTEAARVAGQAFHAAATNALAAGKSFADIAAQQAQLTELTFTLSSPTISGLDAPLDPNQIKNVVTNVKTGGASAFIPTADGGFVLYVRERKPVEDALAQAGLNAFLAELRQERAQDAFNVWLVDQIQKSGANTLVQGLRL